MYCSGYLVNALSVIRLLIGGRPIPIENSEYSKGIQSGHN